jgi:hypothetical protein
MILAFVVGLVNLLLDPLFWILRCPVEDTIQKVQEATLPRPSSSHRSKSRRQLSIKFRKVLNENFNFQHLFQYFQPRNVLGMFFRNEQVITLSKRLVNWHDLIVPSLMKLESDLEFHEKFSFMNQRGNHATIDTKGLLFTAKSRTLVPPDPESQSLVVTPPSSPLSSPSPASAPTTIHHFMHQLKLQHSRLVGKKRQVFEDSWRSKFL